VAFNPARVTDARLAQTTRLPGVTAAAGPFAEATVNVTSVSSITGLPQEPGQPQPSPVPSGPLTVAGRASAGGPVDDLELWLGHWATGPGQIVVNLPASEHVGPQFLGAAVHLSGGQSRRPRSQR
jgi:putative ABC transport system permease protein